MKTDKQLQQESIKSWEGFRKMTVADIRASKNPLGVCGFCNKYKKISRLPDDNRGWFEVFSATPCCNDCPVKIKTGQHICKGTPYYTVRKLSQKICANHDEENLLIKLNQAVNDIIDFLKALECSEVTK